MKKCRFEVRNGVNFFLPMTIFKSHSSKFVAKAERSKSNAVSRYQMPIAEIQRPCRVSTQQVENELRIVKVDEICRNVCGMSKLVYHCRYRKQDVNFKWPGVDLKCKKVYSFHCCIFMTFTWFVYVLPCTMTILQPLICFINRIWSLVIACSIHALIA